MQYFLFFFFSLFYRHLAQPSFRKASAVPGREISNGPGLVAGSVFKIQAITYVEKYYRLDVETASNATHHLSSPCPEAKH